MKKLLLITCLFLFQVTNAQNNAFTFNGIDQQIATYTGQTNVRFTTQNFTIEAWVKPAAFVNSTGSFEHTIIGTDSSNTTGYVLRTGGSRKLDFTFGDGTSWYSVTSANPVFTVDEWTHVGVVRNGTSFTLYANGVQVAQQTFTQNISLPNTNLRIAESPGFNGRFFKGSLDEIKIWNTARTVAEVRNDLAETITPLPIELVVYYKMDQTTGQAVASETAVNLFAQYLATAQVNSGAGFFRTYNYENFDSLKNWINTLNWVNGFVPDNLVANDVININVNCRFNNTSYELPSGCTLNVNNGATLEMSPSINIIFTNHGTLNIYDTFLFYNQSGAGTFNNYGIVTVATSNNFKSNIVVNLYVGSNFNNNGYLGDVNATIYCELNNYGGIITNFSGSVIDITRFFNFGNFINYGTSTSVLLTNGSTSYPNASVSNMSGSITINKRLLNESTINNYANLNLLNDGVSVHKNRSTGVINNFDFQSVFRVNTINASFENEGTFAYQNLVENKGTFTNKSGATLKALNGGNGGSVRQFENFAGATFTNQGTYIGGGDFNNSGTHSNTGTRSGSGNFNNSSFTNPTNAIIAPSTNSGIGIGTLNFFSGLINNGNINIEIGGITAGIDYDKINVTGTATLGGTLNTSIINNYIPPVGTTDFTIISATTISGTFATVNLPTATLGIVWSIVYTSTAVILRAVVTTLSNQNFVENNLKIYPNPTTDILNLDLQEEATLSVFDISGKQLLTQKANGNTQLNLSAFAKGIYVLKVVNANAETKTLKISKD